MDTATSTVADRVARGAELLDQAYVNRDVAWWDQVDLDTLDMYSPTDCVIAQTVGRFPQPRPCWCGGAECTADTTGDYGDGMTILGLPFAESADYGFTPDPHGGAILRDAWRELILARREEALRGDPIPDVDD